MSDDAILSRQHLKAYVLELRADLNRVHESIQLMQGRADQLLGLLQQESGELSERMYRDLERAIHDANNRAFAGHAKPRPDDSVQRGDGADLRQWAEPKQAVDVYARQQPGDPAPQGTSLA